MKKYLIFDIGGTFVKWSIIKSNYEILSSSKWSFDGKNGGKELLIEDLKNKIQEIEKNENIDAIGISAAGIVDPHTKKIVGDNANIKNMDKTDFIQELKSITNKPVFVENDANAAILGESTNEQLKDVNNIMMITLGTGIGGGIIINGKIYQGTSGIAGEIGQCLYNGHRWEYYHSTIGLIRKIKDQLNQELTTYEILESNDIQVKNVLNEWYEGIAYVLANMITFMNFEAIIIGGGISESNLFDIEIINNKIKDFLPLKQLHNTFVLLKAKLGNTAAIIGMTKLINEELLH